MGLFLQTQDVRQPEAHMVKDPLVQGKTARFQIVLHPAE